MNRISTYTLLWFASMLFLFGSWCAAQHSNLPLCTASNEQLFPDLVSDGHRGAIIAWMDARNGNRDVFIQRIDVNGKALWKKNGIAICQLPGSQGWPILIPTLNNNGAIIVWRDSRNGNQDLYAQRIDINGTELWDKNGIPICQNFADQDDPRAIADGKDGVIVVWEDWRNSRQDLFAQRINGGGETIWKEDGVAIYDGEGDQYDPSLTTDQAGGAIFAWWDISTPEWRVFSQRISSDGRKLWSDRGITVCEANGNQGGPSVVSDGAGGVFVVWSDYRNDPAIFTTSDLYAQRINANGQHLWNPDGIVICNQPENQQQPFITHVNQGIDGIVVTWWDDRDVFSDIYAQWINGNGEPMWKINGLPICTAEGEQRQPKLIRDKSDGTIIYWLDYRGDYGNKTTSAIYAQRIDENGRSLWELNGMPICLADGEQMTPDAIMMDNMALIAWSDGRNGESYDIDIYVDLIQLNSNTIK